METIRYLSAQEISDAWGISKRRVQNLCVNNRIHGAVRIGNMWAIPFNAIKPKDARIRNQDDIIIPIGTQIRKGRKDLKAIVETSMKDLQAIGQTPIDALHALVTFFAANLLNRFIDDFTECVSVCENFFNHQIDVTFPAKRIQDIEKYISENEMCLDDSLSWVYQFGSKKSTDFIYRDTQFFTEKYMISTLVDSLYLDMESKVIDPACGGANFLLYSFTKLIEVADKDSNVTEKINIVLDKLCGYEIDCFLSYVAAFNLKLKALSYVRNVVHIDAKTFLTFRTKIYHPKVDSIPGFLEHDWNRQTVVNCDSGEEINLNDAFDGVNVVVTNPPFRTVKGMPIAQKVYLQENYPLAKCDLCNAFIERVMDILPADGKAALVTQNSWMYLDSFVPLRRMLLRKYSVADIWELGSNAFYDLSGEKANVALVILEKSIPNESHSMRLRNLRGMDIDEIEKLLATGKPKATVAKQTDVLGNAESRFDMFSTTHLKSIQSSCRKYKDYAVPMQGTSTGDAKKLIDYYWRHIGDDDWVLVSKGGGYSRYEGLNSYCVKWGRKGEYIKNTKGSAIRNANYFEQTQLVFSDTGTAGLNVRLLMPGQIFVASGPGIRINSGKYLAHLAFLNSRYASFFVRLVSPKLTIAAGYIGQIPVSESLLDSVILEECAKQCIAAKAKRLAKRAANIEFSYIVHQPERSILDSAKAWYEEDLHDEWIQLVNEQKVEDEIIREMELTPEDSLAIDSYIGSKKIMSIQEEPNLKIDRHDFFGMLDANCLPKRTKSSKNSLGSDGLIEHVSQITGISCQSIYSTLLHRFEWFADSYTDLYLHALLLSALEYRNHEIMVCKADVAINKAGIRLDGDVKLAKKWIETRFNEVHRESFMNSPIIEYDPEKAVFFRIKE